MSTRARAYVCCHYVFSDRNLLKDDSYRYLRIFPVIEHISRTRPRTSVINTVPEDFEDQLEQISLSHKYISRNNEES